MIYYRIESVGIILLPDPEVNQMIYYRIERRLEFEVPVSERKR
jgi:hypothetical protein